jgi:hypothetical protein
VRYTKPIDIFSPEVETALDHDLSLDISEIIRVENISTVGDLSRRLDESHYEGGEYYGGVFSSERVKSHFADRDSDLLTLSRFYIDNYGNTDEFVEILKRDGLQAAILNSAILGYKKIISERAQRIGSELKEIIDNLHIPEYSLVRPADTGMGIEHETSLRIFHTNVVESVFVSSNPDPVGEMWELDIYGGKTKYILYKPLKNLSLWIEMSPPEYARFRLKHEP